MANTKLQQALDQANGRRRTRLLNLDDIVTAAQGLNSGEHAFLHGGHVANAYRYPSCATGAVVWIPTGKRAAFCCISVVSAQKGSSGFGRESCWTPEHSGLDAIRITPEDKRIANAD